MRDGLMSMAGERISKTASGDGS